MRRSGRPRRVRRPQQDLDRRGVVINAAAYTAVDAAETDSDRAYAVNRDGAAHRRRRPPTRVGLIHVSTDHVFPGDADTPYEPGDPTGPRSVYGASKLAGEQAVLGCTPAPTWCAPRGSTARPAATSSRPWRCWNRRSRRSASSTTSSGRPTWSADLAAGLLELAAAEPVVPGGVLHATGGGSTTWFGFARAIFTELGADPERAQPTTTGAFPRPAPRPAYSVLSPAAWVAAGLTPLPVLAVGTGRGVRRERAAFRPDRTSA